MYNDGILWAIQMSKYRFRITYIHEVGKEN